MASSGTPPLPLSTTMQLQAGPSLTEPPPPSIKQVAPSASLSIPLCFCCPGPGVCFGGSEDPASMLGASCWTKKVAPENLPEGGPQRCRSMWFMLREPSGRRRVPSCYFMGSRGVQSFGSRPSVTTPVLDLLVNFDFGWDVLRLFESIGLQNVKQCLGSGFCLSILQTIGAHLL